MARRSGLDWLLTERSLEPSIAPLVSEAGSSIKALLFPLEWDVIGRGSAPLACPASSTSPCLLQHSSGTTGLQKAVMLSHRAVLDHVERYAEAIALSPTDRIASWLPLYHDMGLLAAFHLPLAMGVPVVQLDPFEWIGAPHLLLEAIGRERATLAWLPNFAYDFMADRVHDDDLEGVRLDSVRLLTNCSEPVRATSHAKMFARFGPLGLREAGLGACYAMAETTFAVTQTRPGTRAREIVVQRDALVAGTVVLATSEAAEAALASPGDAATVRVCVSSGAPIRDAGVRLQGAEGVLLGDGQVGEIHVRSVSLFSGYRNDPVASTEALNGDWYRTGDLGFTWEGELFVTGRKKDLIIVAGKNLYPEDIEDAVGSVAGLIPGRAVAVGVEDPERGTEEVWVIAETEVTGDRERKLLRTAVVRAAMGIDVTVSRVVLAPPRWLVKSSSGKLARSANKTRVLTGELPG
jgi:acyl-CoA synthetase (AMP-forming)/AMP-acid ligase II